MPKAVNGRLKVNHPSVPEFYQSLVAADNITATSTKENYCRCAPLTDMGGIWTLHQRGLIHFSSRQFLKWMLHCRKSAETYMAGSCRMRQ
jgi:hypothetical protein